MIAKCLLADHSEAIVPFGEDSSGAIFRAIRGRRGSAPPIAGLEKQPSCLSICSRQAKADYHAPHDTLAPRSHAETKRCIAANSHHPGIVNKIYLSLNFDEKMTHMIMNILMTEPDVSASPIHLNNYFASIAAQDGTIIALVANVLLPKA